MQRDFSTDVYVTGSLPFILVGYILKREFSLSAPSGGTLIIYKISIFKHLSIG